MASFPGTHCKEKRFFDGFQKGFLLVHCGLKSYEINLQVFREFLPTWTLHGFSTENSWNRHYMKSSLEIKNSWKIHVVCMPINTSSTTIDNSLPSYFIEKHLKPMGHGRHTDVLRKIQRSFMDFCKTSIRFPWNIYGTFTVFPTME